MSSAIHAIDCSMLVMSHRVPNDIAVTARVPPRRAARPAVHWWTYPGPFWTRVQNGPAGVFGAGWHIGASIE
ncbi:hypothetical protein [Kibdelosporangium philippinense]|uniref:hypothetical protein n=1 Tax=Kibdelosporangium philippinense TaxID=211113 RepID=UPI0036196FDD